MPPHVRYRPITELPEPKAATIPDIEPHPDDHRFAPQVYRTPELLGVIAPTWEVSTKYTFDHFLEDWRKDPNGTMRDYGSVPSFSIEALFHDPEIIDIRANYERSHPFDENDNPTSALVPDGKHHYFLHVDLSKSWDATGIAMAHWDKDAVRRVPGVGEVIGQVVVDFMFQIEPLPGEDVDYEQVQQLIYSLKARGFYLRLVSFDQFQSIFMMQQLERRGFNVNLFSVDRTPSAYQTLMELMLQGKLDYYPFSPFINELKRLEVRNGKVTPARGSTNDVADAVSAAVYHAFLAAGTEVYAVSRTVSREKAQRMKDDRDRRAILLGFKETSSRWY